MSCINLCTLNYRLNGFTVNQVISNAKDLVENKLKVDIEHCPKSIFYKILKTLNLEKEFRSFVKERGVSEEALYAPFLKNRVSELMHNINYWARVFQTEEEDRTNGKHRRHIRKMLPYLRELGQINAFFTPDNNSKQAFSNNSINSIKALFNGNIKKHCYSFGINSLN